MLRPPVAAYRRRAGPSSRSVTITAGRPVPTTFQAGRATLPLEVAKTPASVATYQTFPGSSGSRRIALTGTLGRSPLLSIHWRPPFGEYQTWPVPKPETVTQTRAGADGSNTIL